MAEQSAVEMKAASMDEMEEHPLEGQTEAQRAFKAGLSAKNLVSEVKPKPKPIKGALNSLSEIEDFLQKKGKIPSPAVFEEPETLEESASSVDPIDWQQASAPLSSIATEQIMAPQKLTEPLQWVWVGFGIKAIWQAEDQLAWRLWQNILKAFQLRPEQTQFFDVQQLQSESDFEQCAEVLIASGIEWVWVDETALETPLVAWLAESVEVVPVPSLQQMLEDPQAKQRFFQACCHLR